MKFTKITSMLFLGTMTASAIARTANEAHNLSHEIWGKVLASGTGDYSELLPIYAEDVVIDFTAYAPFFPGQSIYKGRGNVGPWLNSVGNNIDNIYFFEWTNDFGVGEPKSSVITHNVIAKLKSIEGIHKFKTYCTYKLNADGLASHVGYAIAEHKAYSDYESCAADGACRTANEAHNLAHEIWFKILASGTGDYSEILPIYAEDVVIDMSAYAPFIKGTQPIYKGRHNVAPWLTAVDKDIDKMYSFKWTNDFGVGLPKSSVITHNVVGTFKSGEEIHRFKALCTYKLNDDGLVSHVGYGLAEHQTYSDHGSCAADGTCTA